MSTKTLSTTYGWGLMIPVMLLCVMGILTIQVTTGSSSNPWHSTTAIKQIAFVFAGLIAALTVILIGYHRLGRLSYFWFFLGIGLLIYLVTERLTGIDMPFVTRQRAAWRWIKLGPVTIQPSELMKIAYVLGLAWYLRYRRNYRTFKGLVMPFLLTLLPMMLIKLQPDLGMLLLFLPVLFAMLFVAGARKRHLSAIIVLGILCMPFFWLKIEPYQRLRLAGVALQSESLRNYLLDEGDSLWKRFQPPNMSDSKWQQHLTDWQTETGYQLVRSKTAVGSGGLYGQGRGQGIFIDHKFLPERHNDFIFSMIGHQWGWIGCVLVVIFYCTIVVLGFDIATTTNDPFGRLVAVGMTIVLAVQTLTNIGMTVGLGPITGVTLPFVSAGGSSMIASFICLGFLISVARRGPVLMGEKSFEFDPEAERYQR